MNEERKVDLDSTSCKPGGRVSGRVAWKCADTPRQVEIRLFWQVIGEGVDEAHVVDSREIQFPSADQDDRFEFSLPGQPYSYEGTLFSIKWGVELLVDDRASVSLFSMR